MPDNWRNLYPFSSHWLEIDGNRYHYLDEGDPSLPPLILLHGNPTWSFYYRTLIPALKKKYRVVVPDHMGCGLSDKPQKYAYTLETHINNLEQLISHLDLRSVGLIMHDWGGTIGMGYAVRHPDNVSRFVVFNSGAFHARSGAIPFIVRICGVPVCGPLLVQGLNAFARVAAVVGARNRKRMTKQVKAGLLAPYNSWKNRNAIYRFVKDIPLKSSHISYAALSRIDSGLGRLSRCPMLIVWGGKDFVFSVRYFLTVWRERFPGAEVMLLEDAGHYVVEDAHERILPRLEDFLARNP